MRDEYQQLFASDEVKGLISMYEGAEEGVKQLKERNYVLGVLSNGSLKGTRPIPLLPLLSAAFSSPVAPTLPRTFRVPCYRPPRTHNYSSLHSIAKGSGPHLL